MKNKAPNKLHAPECATRTVRERTLEHMEVLFRRATSFGAGMALACGVATQGCIRHTVDPPPPPPPGFCENPDLLIQHGCVQTNAHWERSGRKWTIALNIGLAWGVVGASFEGIAREQIKVSGATVENVAPSSQRLGLVLMPVRGRKQVELECSMQADGKPTPLRLNLDLGKRRRKNGPVPVQLLR